MRHETHTYARASRDTGLAIACVANGLIGVGCLIGAVAVDFPLASPLIFFGVGMVWAATMEWNRPRA